MRDNFKYISGALSVGIYLTLISVVLYYFNFRSIDTTKHYVKKNTNSIAIALTNPESKSNKSSKSNKNKAAKKKPKKVKKVRNISSKKPHKQKSKKAKKLAKKIKPKNLFSSVKTHSQKTKPKVKKSTAKKKTNTSKKTAQQILNESLRKSRQDDKGIENAYFASVEEKLKGWPAQANYAGEKISVWIKVDKSGYFIFKVQYLSSNTEFNEALIAYLKQLQEIGLGTHNRDKPYEIDVEFIAED